MDKRQKMMQQWYLDEEIKIIQQLHQIYSEALKDINRNIKKQMERFDPETGDLPQSAIYQIKYQQMLRGQIEDVLNNLQTSQYLLMSDYLDGCYEDGFVGSVFDMHGQGVPLMMPIDRNAMVQAVTLDSKISKGLYTRLGEDITSLKEKITSEVSRSILNGTGYAETARQLAGITRIGYNNAIRITRTEGHRIQVTATMDAMEAAKDRGADVVKQWDSTLDGRTRPSHWRVDGEIREVDETFSNGLKFPGDPNGRAAEVVNCRCALLERARWALGEEELETLKKRAEYFGLDKSEQFDDFKKKYLVAVKEILEDRNRSSIIVAGRSTDGFDRKTRFYELEEDLMAVNPNYSTKEYKWTMNCQRCVSTYEMRRRGYRVTARPIPGRVENDDLAAWFELAWENADRKWCMSGSGKKQVEGFMKRWGDGSRAVVGVGFDSTSGHVFFAEQIDGETVYVDPQNPSADCAEYFKMAVKGRTHITRIDNLQPSDRITDCCKNGDR